MQFPAVDDEQIKLTGATGLTGAPPDHAVDRAFLLEVKLNVHVTLAQVDQLFVAPGTGGESYQMLLDRIRPWFEALDRPTVCVTHGGVLRVLFRLVEDLPPDEVAAMDIPQDRVLRLKESRLEWL